MSKIEAAKAFLGTRWVGHPDYKFDPRHSPDQRLYVPARQPYLRSIEKAAAASRLSNPTCLTK